jgi:hypothetical protein
VLTALLEPLRAAIAAAGVKVEQETIQRRLYALLDAGGEPGSRPA